LAGQGIFGPMANPWNFTCLTCNAKLLAKRRREPFKRGEKAFCPFCNSPLPPRDAEDTISYELVQAPTAKAPKRPRDFSQAAKLVIDVATGQIEDREPTPEEQGKDPAAAALGRKGGAARAKSTSAARRVEIAKRAAASRWRKKP